MGNGCPSCGYISVANTHRIGTFEIINRSKNTHGDKYDYSKTIYKGTGEKVEILCPEHGTFFQDPFEHINGCGCPRCHESRGERRIRLFLLHNKVTFIPEYRFSDCVDKKPLPFDFYLPDLNIVIEYQGLQHYQPFERWGGQVMLDYVKRHDTIKREFCNKNGIRLEEIKYSDNIEDRLKSIFKPI